MGWIQFTSYQNNQLQIGQFVLEQAGDCPFRLICNGTKRICSNQIGITNYICIVVAF